MVTLFPSSPARKAQEGREHSLASSAFLVGLRSETPTAIARARRGAVRGHSFFIRGARGIRWTGGSRSAGEGNGLRGSSLARLSLPALERRGKAGAISPLCPRFVSADCYWPAGQPPAGTLPQRTELLRGFDSPALLSGRVVTVVLTPRGWGAARGMDRVVGGPPGLIVDAVCGLSGPLATGRRCGWPRAAARVLPPLNGATDRRSTKWATGPTTLRWYAPVSAG